MRPPRTSARRQSRLLLQHRELVPVTVAILLLLAVVATDFVTSDDTVFISLLITAPLVTAAFTRPGVTAAVGVTAALLALALVPSSLFGTANHLIRVAAIVAGSLIAVFVSARREQRDRALTQITAVADVAQNAVLWPVPPKVGDLSLAARYVSASVAARIGGDLYEVVDSPFGPRLLMGDVRGKGLDAVRLASAVLGCFREVAYTRPDLPDVHEALEATVRRIASPEDFVTVVLVEITPTGGRILSCGHPPPLLALHHAVETVAVHEPALPLGLRLERPVPNDFAFPPGARLLLHTDGLLEARNEAGEFFPVLEHGDVLCRSGELAACLDELLERLRDHSGGHIDDDVALLMVQRDPVRT